MPIFRLCDFVRAIIRRKVTETFLNLQDTTRDIHVTHHRSALKNEGHSQFKIMKKHTHKTLLSILPMLSEYQKLGKTCLPVSYRKKKQYHVHDDQKMQIRVR